MKCFKVTLMMLALAWPATARAELAGTPFVEGLKTPIKIVLTRGGNLLVSEGGNPPPTFVAHHGRISLVDRGGARRTLIDRLPAGLDLDDGGSSGPSGLWVADRFTLYVAREDRSRDRPDPDDRPLPARAQHTVPHRSALQSAGAQ